MKQLSQNFLCNRELVTKLIRGSSITSDDTVLETGPGRGIITEHLLKSANQVIAVELDDNLYKNLKLRLTSSNLTLVREDFLNYKLPSQPYKVFSNIPFSITADIMRKLLASNLSEAYLVVQSEAAAKFIANSYRNTLVALQYFPIWDMKVTHRFNKNDFNPRPKVDSVLLNIKRRPESLIADLPYETYLDYLAYYFGRDRLIKFTPPESFREFY